MSLTAERVRELLSYDPGTGILAWKIKAAWQVNIGDRAGWVTSNGYREVSIGHRQYKAHRLAWLYQTGDWPRGDLDHQDNDRDNNAFKNLRPATDSQNGGNARKSKANTSGFKGVSFHKGTQLWQARICINYRSHFLGRFNTPEAAHAAYQAAAIEAFGAYARAA